MFPLAQVVFLLWYSVLLTFISLFCNLPWVICLLPSSTI